MKSKDVFKTNEKLSELTSQRANFSQTCELQPNRKWAKGQAADRNRNLGDADTELEECRWTTRRPTFCPSARRGLKAPSQGVGGKCPLWGRGRKQTISGAHGAASYQD